MELFVKCKKNTENACKIMKNGNIYTDRLRGTDTVMLESDDNYNKYGNHY